MSTPPSTHPREREVFMAVVEIESVPERAVFLDQACGQDAHLRARVEALLAMNDGETITSPAPTTTGDASSENDTQLHEPQEGAEGRIFNRGDSVGYFGDYELLEKIASGGMGVVWRARQISLKRTVALKMIRGALLASDADVQRFHVEAEAAAGLDHPNIVPIYEIGEQEDQHFFSMKLIEGGTLADHQKHLHKHRRDAVRLMVKAARAVDAAHRAGILHRDLKPGNILIDAEGDPHLTDFGLAKKIDGPQYLTLSGQVMGTPHYMAPEQARGDSRHVSTAADIYSLGAMLFELLSGQKLFHSVTLAELLHEVIHEVPSRLRSVDSSVDADLETIVAKCLEKDSRSRYRSCADLADDLDRWLEGKPIAARPVSPAERCVKWIRRKPLHATLAAVASALVLTLAVGGPIVAVEQANLRQEAVDNAEASRRALAKAQIALAEAAFTAHDEDRMIKFLAECPEDQRDTNWHYLKARSTDWVRTNIGGLFRGVSADPLRPGMFYVLDQGRGRGLHPKPAELMDIRHVDGRTGEIRQHTQVRDSYADMNLSPDGKMLATFGRRAPEVDFFTTDPLQPLRDFRNETFGGSGGGIFFSPDNAWLLAQRPGMLRINTQTGVFTEERIGVRQFEWLPRRKAILGVQGLHLVLFGAESGETRWKAGDPLPDCRVVRSSRDERIAIAGAADGTVALYSMNDGRRLNEFAAHEGQVDLILPGNDPHQFVTVGDAVKWKSIKLWGTQNTRNPIRSFPLKVEHRMDVKADWDPHSGVLLGGLGMGAAYQLPFLPSEVVGEFHESTVIHQPTVMFLDETTLAAPSGDAGLAVVDLAEDRSGTPLWEYPGHPDLIRSHDRRFVLATRLYNIVGKSQRMYFEVTRDGPVELDVHQIAMDCCGVSSDGKHVLVGNNRENHLFTRGSDDTWTSTPVPSQRQLFPGLKVDDAFTSILFPRTETPHVLISYLIAGSRRSFQLYDITAMQQVWLRNEPHGSRSVLLDPTGSLVVTGSADGVLRGYHAMTLDPVFEARLHDRDITAAAIPPDLSMVATGDANGLIRIFKLTAGGPGELLWELAGSGGRVDAIDFNPSGSQLAAISGAHIRVWNLDGHPVADRRD